MKRRALAVTTGFAMFSMFFGSGNLVFPLAVGAESEGHYFFASVGIFCTCVLFPFLGLLAVGLCGGDHNRLYSCFGRKGAFVFSLLALSLLGPFGVLARCLTVAHGALLLVFPDTALQWTSAGICALIFILGMNKGRTIDVVGTILSPVLLIAIVAIAYAALMHGGVEYVAAATGGWRAMTNGYFEGYQTMDLIASLYFSGYVIRYLNGKFGDGHDHALKMRTFLASSLIGAALLYFVYLILIYLGATYAEMLSDVPPQEMLGRVAYETLGPMAAPCVCLTVFLACLTTALALASLFADFFRNEVCRGRIGGGTSLAVTLAISFLVSTLDFNGIAALLKPILSVTYPAVIVLTAASIASHFTGRRASHWPFSVALVLKLLWI